MQMNGPCLFFFLPLPRPLILMRKDAGKDKKKHFVILQMNSFNLDKFSVLLTVLGQFVSVSQ